MSVRTKTWTVTPIGVGRKDYSIDVQYSVEPTIRSYQSQYSYNQTISIAGGAFQDVTIGVPTGRVIMLNDVVLSVPANVLIGLDVTAIEAGVLTVPISQTEYQAISEHRTQGLPFFSVITFRITNYSTLTLSFYLCLNGFILGIQEYEQQYYPGV